VLDQILGAIDEFPDDIKMIVEFSPTSAARDAFNNLSQLGFIAYEIENIYQNRWYFEFGAPSMP